MDVPRVPSMRSSLAFNSPNSPLHTYAYWIDSSFMAV